MCNYTGKIKQNARAAFITKTDPVITREDYRLVNSGIGRLP